MRALVLVLLLAGCTSLPSGFTVPQELAVACRGYAATLSAITPFKSRMNAEQVAFINEANAVVVPACETASVGVTTENGAALLRTVRDRLRQMLIIEQEVRAQ